MARRKDLSPSDDGIDSGLERQDEQSGLSSSDEESPATKRRPQPIFEKDSEEEELERLVLGDTANFRHELFKDETVGSLDLRCGDSAGGAKNKADTDDVEALNDAQLFFLDAPTSVATENKHVSLSAKPGDLGQEELPIDVEGTPAWEDSDDERLTISLASVTQLRKLRLNEDEDVVDGATYTKRLQQQYLRLNPMPEWARREEKRLTKRRWRSSAASSDNESQSLGSSEETDEEMNYDNDPSGLPLDKFLRDVKSMRGEGQSSSKRRKLKPEAIDIQRSRDMADSHKDEVSTLSFHPEFPVLLSASTSTLLYLHHVDPAAHPTPNPLLTSVQVKQVPIRHAEFLQPAGDKIYFAGRRRFIHSWDLPTGLVQKTERIHGHHLEQRTWERFKISPCGRYLGMIASTHKGGGIVNILSVSTMQWIAAARLDSRSGIAEFQWWGNGNGMTILGKNGHVGEWSMAFRRFMGIWLDSGSIGGIVLALGGRRKGPELLGGDKWVAIGSKDGITTIYNRHDLISPSSTDDELDITKTPEPKRRFEQLTTPVTFLTFSPDGQLLTFGSKHKKDALKLAHLPTCTVYRNWPTAQTPLGRITAVAFGSKSDMLAVGNDSGKIRLWEIRD